MSPGGHPHCLLASKILSDFFFFPLPVFPAGCAVFLVGWLVWEGEFSAVNKSHSISLGFRTREQFVALIM